MLDLTRGNEAHVHFEAKKMWRPEIVARLAQVGASPLKEATRNILDPGAVPSSSLAAGSDAASPSSRSSPSPSASASASPSASKAPPE